MPEQERAVLNPAEFMPDSIEVPLDDLGLGLSERVEGIDWGEATIQPQMNREAEGESSTDGHRPGVPIRIPIRVHEDGDVPLAEAAHTLESVMGGWQEEGGWIRRDFAEGAGFSSSLAYRIYRHTAQISGLQGWLWAHRFDAPDVVLTATRHPIGYVLVEVATEEFTEESARALQFEIAHISGTAPGLIQILVKNKGTEHWRAAIFAAESRDHPQDETAETTAALEYMAADLTPKGGAKDIGGGVVEHGSLTAGWLSILSSAFIPKVRSVGAVASGTGSISPGLPAGVEAGDLLVMFAESGGASAAGAATTPLTASGWASPPAPYAAQAQGNTRTTVLYRFAGSSNPTATNDTGDHQMARIVCVKKGSYDPEAPFNTAGVGVQAATKSVSIPGATTTRPGCLVLACATGHLPDATSTTEFGAPANASLTELTELVDNATTAGDGAALYVASGYMLTAGTYATTTCTAATEAERGVISLAINPPVSRHMTHKGVRRLWLRGEQVGGAAGDVQLRIRRRSLGQSAWEEKEIVSPPVGAYQLLDMGECRNEAPALGDPRWEYEVLARSLSGAGKVRLKEQYPLPTEQFVVVRAPRVPLSPDRTTAANAPASASQISHSEDSTENGEWSNPTRAFTSNNEYATASYNGVFYRITRYLALTNFGFTLPSGSTPVSVVVALERKASHNNTGNEGAVADHSARLIQGEAAVGPDLFDGSIGTLWGTTDHVASYVFSAESLLDLGLKASDVNASSFGFGIAVWLLTGISGLTVVASVDAATMMIGYTEEGDPNRVCMEKRSLIIGSEGVHRQHPTDDVWGRLVEEGFLPEALPSGLSERKFRGIIIPSQGDLGELPDVGLNPLAAVASTRAGHHFAPEPGS